ncbi:MAG: RNA polymerase sigma factor, partial [Planctomycetota bacterium]
MELPELSMALRGLPHAAGREALRPCDRTSLAERLEGLHARSFSWALGCCRGDREEAQEVLQTAYVRVLDGRARFRGSAAFPTWLFGVIRRVAAGRRRGERLRRMLQLRFGERIGGVSREEDPSGPLL